MNYREDYINEFGNVDTTEFFKLCYLCAEEGIIFEVSQLFNGYQIKTAFDDAVIHFGSHGSDFGLLESCRLNDCVGYQTAEEIFNFWKRLSA